uniref:PHLC protein n=1 Tax=Fopius arisanus TaxID=64838 RepID=A0A0C9R1V7_9HYME
MCRLLLLLVLHLNLLDLSSSEDETLVILTLSPAEEDETTRKIGVYYHCPDCAPGDVLRVADEHQIFEKIIGDPRGFLRTDLRVSPESFSDITATILRNGELIYSSPVIDRANWMHDNKSILKYLSLPQLVIPGTHQSGAYDRPETHGIWNLCQDLSIEDQLTLGIRYIDVQPSCKRIEDQCQSFFMEYSLLEMLPMDAVFSEIKGFLNRTNEIVILSLSDFSSEFQSDEDHARFMEFIKHELADDLFSFNTTSHGWSTPLGKIWKAEKRLIISYNYGGPVDPTFGTGVQPFWCNCQRSDDLHVFFADPQKRKNWANRKIPSVDVVELIPGWQTVVPHDSSNSAESSPPFSFKAWTEEFSPKVCEWYHEQWNATSNVVVVDFFETTGVVDLAVHWNKKRGEDTMKKITSA